MAENRINGKGSGEQGRDNSRSDDARDHLRDKQETPSDPWERSTQAHPKSYLQHMSQSHKGDCGQTRSQRTHRWVEQATADPIESPCRDTQGKAERQSNVE